MASWVMLLESLGDESLGKAMGACLGLGTTLSLSSRVSLSAVFLPIPGHCERSLVSEFAIACLSISRESLLMMERATFGPTPETFSIRSLKKSFCSLLLKP